jgi:cobalt-zinc-cadmium efflux system protein
VLATMLIARAPGRQSLNIAGAFRHVLTDLYAFIATAIAGLIVVVSGFERADAIATLLVVALMLHAGYGLLKDSGRIFLEAAPSGLSPAAVGTAMAARPHVTEVHDLHIWEITSGQPAASAHVLVTPGADCHAIRADLEAFLAESYGITHATLQVDHAESDHPAGPSAEAQPRDGTAPAPGHCADAHGPAYRRT